MGKSFSCPYLFFFNELIIIWKKVVTLHSEIKTIRNYKTINEMKKFILIALAAVCTLSVSAQKFSDFFSTERSHEKIVYGIRAGLNVMGMKNNVTNDVVVSAFGNRPYELGIHRKAGLTFGVSVEIPILKNLWVNTGLYYVATGTKLNFKRDFSKIYEGNLPEYSANVTMHNVRIPAQASYRYDINNDYQIQVNLGPYFAYGLSGKTSVKNEVDGSSLGSFNLTGNKKFSVDPGIELVEDILSRDEVRILGLENINSYKSNYVNPFDMGIAFGAGVTYKKKYFAGFNYDAGLVNVNGKRTRALIHNSIKNHSFTLNVGYNF
jgi:hypothetical protein